MLNLFDKKIKNILHKVNQTTNINKHVTTESPIIYNEKESKDNIVGNTKYYPSANKEWSSSVYTYNKNSTKFLPIKHEMVNRLLKTYFNLTSFYKIKNMPKGRRSNIIRRHSRIKRVSTNRIFVSKSEIKHNSDRVIISVYVLDKERESLIRKLFFINNSFKLNKYLNLFYKKHARNTSESHLIQNNSTLYHNRGIANGLTHKKTGFFPIYIADKISSKKLDLKLKIKTKLNKQSANPKYKYFVKKNSFRKKLAISLLRKKLFLKNIFFFSFLKWILWIFQIKVRIINTKRRKLITIISKETKTLVLKKDKYFLYNLKKLNNVLLHILIATLDRINEFNSSNIIKERKIYFLFDYFKGKYYRNFVKKYLKRQILALHYLYMVSLNNFKFDKFLPGIKLLINKVFNKKVDLNFVFLKYPHLNSDILSEAVATRLVKKNSKLLLVIKRFLSLVKLPHKVYNKNNFFSLDNTSRFMSQDSFLNKYKDLNVNLFLPTDSKPLVNVRGNDLLQLALQNIFYDVQEKKEYFSPVDELKQFKNKEMNILNNTKYKWIKGIRLEAKGRLTRRYTASRSVFKLKYKGNLKNIDSFNGLSSVMLRGDVKPNIDYTFTKATKRIGAFGIKGWISGK